MLRFSEINCLNASFTISKLSGINPDCLGGGEHSEHDEQCSLVFVVLGRTWRTSPLRDVRCVRLHGRLHGIAGIEAVWLTAHAWSSHMPRCPSLLRYSFPRLTSGFLARASVEVLPPRR